MTRDAAPADDRRDVRGDRAGAAGRRPPAAPVEDPAPAVPLATKVVPAVPVFVVPVPAVPVLAMPVPTPPAVPVTVAPLPAIPGPSTPVPAPVVVETGSPPSKPPVQATRSNDIVSSARALVMVLISLGRAENREPRERV